MASSMSSEQSFVGDIEIYKSLGAEIKEISLQNDVVFLDYNTCTDISDMSKPLSHANLVRLYIEDTYPF